MENRIPPLPPKRPFIQKTENEYNLQNNVDRNINNKLNSNSEKEEKQGQGEAKKKFVLNSQTKAFILSFAAFFCLAGAVACFVFLFI